MRPAETILTAAVLLLACHTGYGAEPATYGQVETFEPGKKYNCVPTADHKGWDCSEAGTGKPAQHHAPAAPPVATPAPETPRAAAEKSAPIPVQATAPAPATAPIRPGNSRSGELPSYLTNAAANGRPSTVPPARAAAAAPQPPAQSAPAPAPPAQTPTTATAVSPTKSPPEQAATPTASPPPEAPPSAAPELTPPAPAAAPLPERVAPVAETVASPPKPAPAPVTHAPPPPAAVAHTTDGARASSDFLNLSGDRFVVELAHGASESDLAAARTSLQPSHGDLYTVHLRQNGADTWLLVWGTFDSIEAARSARSEIAAQGAFAPGWPRKIAPLQAEVRRVLEQ